MSRRLTAASSPAGSAALQALVERVITTAGRGQPADALLRKALKSGRDLSPAEAARASRAVFSYYRWHGWLDQRQPLRVQIDHALHLADRYAREPDAFSDADLLARVGPVWLNQQMQITPSWARSLQAEPKLWLRARPGQGAVLSARLGNCRAFGPGPLADVLEYQGRTDLFRTPEFHAGEFELQDLSSQAVGLVCLPEPGETWWDACAGEGGKTLHLSDLMGNQGRIWASDRAEWRLRLLKRRAARAHVFNYRCAVWDGGPKRPTRTQCDGVLIDAPCSGIGTWQRNPHARWTTTLQDVVELAQTQQGLLAHAAAAVKPGGRLVYAVCTLARAETLEVADAFERSRPEFVPWPLRHPLAPARAAEARLWFWPQEFGGNGMFLAAWRRRAAPG